MDAGVTVAGDSKVATARSNSAETVGVGTPVAVAGARVGSMTAGSGSAFDPQAIITISRTTATNEVSLMFLNGWSNPPKYIIFAAPRGPSRLKRRHAGPAG